MQGNGVIEVSWMIGEIWMPVLGFLKTDHNIMNSSTKKPPKSPQHFPSSSYFNFCFFFPGREIKKRKKQKKWCQYHCVPGLFNTAKWTRFFLLTCISYPGNCAKYAVLLQEVFLTKDWTGMLMCVEIIPKKHQRNPWLLNSDFRMSLLIEEVRASGLLGHSEGCGDVCCGFCH